MSDQDKRPLGADTRGQEAEDMRQLWSQVFSSSGALSGFCLEWILDRAEFTNGRTL